MSKMSLAKVISKRLKSELVSKRLRMFSVALGDFLGDIRFFVDSALASEVFSFILQKLASDSVSSTDQAIAIIGKPFSDDVGMNDIATLSATKYAIDVVSVDESLAFVVGNSLFDTFVVDESASLGLGKIFADSSTLADVQIRSVAKGLVDSNVFGDTHSLIAAKALNDSPSTIDSKSVTFSKFVSESLYSTDDVGATGTVDDDQVLQVQKRTIDFGQFVDAVVLTASFDRNITDFDVASDNLARSVTYERSFSDLVNTTDSPSIFKGQDELLSDSSSLSDNYTAYLDKSQSDTIGAADYGILLSQGYVDNNLYFADDYVGEKRTF